VYLPTGVITSSKFALSPLASASPNSIAHCIAVYLKTSTMKTSKFLPSWPEILLATGLGNTPAVRVQTGKTVQFGSRTVQKPDAQRPGGPNPDPYPSTRGFYRVWLDPLVPISSSVYRVVLFLIAFRYPNVNRNILTFAYH
jgi:hypothetical protein